MEWFYKLSFFHLWRQDVQNLVPLQQLLTIIFERFDKSWLKLSPLTFSPLLLHFVKSLWSLQERLTELSDPEGGRYTGSRLQTADLFQHKGDKPRFINHLLGTFHLTNYSDSFIFSWPTGWICNWVGADGLRCLHWRPSGTPVMWYRFWWQWWSFLFIAMLLFDVLGIHTSTGYSGTMLTKHPDGFSFWNIKHPNPIEPQLYMFFLKWEMKKMFTRQSHHYS